jgi:hypothetical protein
MKTSEKYYKIDEDTLQQLAQQLALWAQEFITGGRSPFRRVETFAPLLTETGEINPPLVFWINRDSHMAGGVIFFPDKDEPSPLRQGQLCADALGLNYYVAWGANDIALWQLRLGEWEKVKTLPVGRSLRPGPVDFHEALMGLMEEMKTFSVLGAVSPDKLSPYYLANLARATLLSLLPSLTEHFRIHRGMDNTEQTGFSAERQALGKAILTLTRIMALALYDALPRAVQPQKLEAAVDEAIGNLPSPLPRTLRRQPSETDLPEEALVSLHLLLHRLTQLGMARNPEGALQALEILQKQVACELGGFPLPAPIMPDAGTVLLIHPNGIPDKSTPQMVIASPPLLALQSLLRHGYKLPAPLACTADPMAMPPGLAPQHICGTLMDGRLPTTAERQSLAAQLRLSWPARRFRFPPRAPLWTWHLLHLLGLGAEGARFNLATPPRWLTSGYGRQLLGLILETTTLQRLQETDNSLCLQFCKVQQSDSSIMIEHPSRARSVTNAQLHQGHLSLLQLALLLPAEIWDMVDDGRLAIPTPKTWPQLLEEGVFFFSRSSLGRYLWHVASGGRALPRRSALRTEVMRQGLPLPGKKTLENLQKLQPRNAGEPPTALLDQELALWLDTDAELPILVKPAPSETSDNRDRDLSEQDLIETVVELVFMDGIPLFPEHYLYDYYRPEMRTYRFDAPLTLTGEFFGTFELREAGGHTLQVEGLETAQALELISALRARSVELPVDRTIAATILDRYRTDLRKLRSSLVKEIFRRQADPQTAKALVEKLWQKQALPPWRMISGS